MTVTINGNGTITPTSAINPTGSVLQVVQSVKTDIASTTSPAETAFVDTGLSVVITPTSSSSKILVLWNIFIGSSGDNVTGLRLQRGTTDILLGVASSTRIRVTQAQGSKYSNDLWQSDVQSGQYIDSPSTTSATTYKFVWCSNGTATSYINRSGRDHAVNQDEDVRATSSMTAMEVAG